MEKSSLILKIGNDAAKQLILLVKHYEGLHDGDLRSIGLQPKMCPAGYWTEGYGQVITDQNGKMLRGEENKELAYKYSKIHTEEQAMNALLPALAAREVFIDRLKLEIDDYQKASLISFAYNVGMKALAESTLVKKIRANATDTEIDVEFRKWNKAGGVVQRGLSNRRTSESYLYIRKSFRAY